MSRNRGGGGQYGGGGGGGLTLQLSVSGKREDLSVTIKLVQGNQPKTNAEVSLFVGTETNPVMHDLKMSVKIGEMGYGMKKLSLKNIAPTYTHLTAVYQTRTDSKGIPGDAEIPEAQKVAVTVKRLKVLPEGDPIVSRSGKFHLTLQTFDESGKKLEAADVLIRTSIPATISDDDTPTVIFADSTKGRHNITDGHAALTVEFPTAMSCVITITHDNSGEVLTINLKLE